MFYSIYFPLTVVALTAVWAKGGIYCECLHHGRSEQSCISTC